MVADSSVYEKLMLDNNRILRNDAIRRIPRGVWSCIPGGCKRELMLDDIDWIRASVRAGCGDERYAAFQLTWRALDYSVHTSSAIDQNQTRWPVTYADL